MIKYRVEDPLSLEDRIQSVLDYIDKKRLGFQALQYYLNDGFNRYCHKFNEDKPLLGYIKKFYLDQQCKDRYNELLEKYGIELVEANKLLLRKCIYLEKLEKLDNQNNQTTDHNPLP